MAYDFKNLNEIPVQDAPTENTTVMAFESGVPKQIPAGEFGSKSNVIVIDGDDESTFNRDTMECVVNYDPIYEALERGETVLLKYTYTNENGTFKDTERIYSWELMPTGLYCVTHWCEVYFTNGSYHTTT